jgi:hypothetical protein
MIAATTRAFADNSSTRGKARRADAGQLALEKSELRAIHVDTNTVLCIAQMGIQPSGKLVPPKGKRPAGIALSGVTALGIGVLDGDILTDVLGQPVRSQFQVIAMVMAARGANMSTISGTLWRGTRAYSVMVDQPYDAPNCSATEPDCWRMRCKDDTQLNGVAIPKVSPAPKARSKPVSKR